MRPDIDGLKETLLLFRNEVAQKVLWGKKYAYILNERDPIKPWEKTESYSWIFFEPHYLFFWGMSDETKAKSRQLTYPECLQEKAINYYERAQIKTTIKNGDKMSSPRLFESCKYEQYGIPNPDPSETLIEYVNRLHELILQDPANTYQKKLWRDSLNSFLEYVRANTLPESHGFLDVIFPQDKALYGDTFVRLILKEKFPTNIIFAAEILKNLCADILGGDLRTQHSACETFAFALLCLTSSRLQFPTELRLLYEFNFESLAVEDCNSLIFPKRYFVKVPTLFGHIPMEVSKLTFSFFQQLALVNKAFALKKRAFKSSERCLREVFARAASKLSLPSKHGKITLTTFTSFPTENLRHRTQIENVRYKVKA